MHRMKYGICVVLLAVVMVVLAIWGPEALAKYQDRYILNRLEAKMVEGESEGYRYTLTSNEKLYILSKCLNSQNLPGSEQNSMARGEGTNAGYQDLTGSYAFVVNHRDPVAQEITDEEIYESCNGGIRELIGLGLLPETTKETSASSYTAVRYSAIYVPEPRNNVSVWRLSLSAGIQNADRQNRLQDAYIDADTGKIYEFYIRTQLAWEDIDPDAMIQAWAGYIGLGEPLAYESLNPLEETTPYYCKYSFEGMENDITVVTIGFYEGINELFLKISR